MEPAHPKAMVAGLTVGARDRILAATLQIVGEDGIAAVSNRRIAAAAGVSLGSVTYHFPTQTELLREALLTFVDDETDRLYALAEDYRNRGLSLTDAAQLTDQVIKDMSFSAEQIAPFELFIQAGRDTGLQAAADECFRAYDALTVAILEALGLPEPERFADSLVAMITGLQVRRLATGGGDERVLPAIMLLLAGAMATS